MKLLQQKQQEIDLTNYTDEERDIYMKGFDTGYKEGNNTNFFNILLVLLILFVVFLIVTASWIWLEYTIDGLNHTSTCDTIIAAIISIFFTAKIYNYLCL